MQNQVQPPASRLAALSGSAPTACGDIKPSCHRDAMVPGVNLSVTPSTLEPTFGDSREQENAKQQTLANVGSSEGRTAPGNRPGRQAANAPIFKVVGWYTSRAADRTARRCSPAAAPADAREPPVILNNPAPPIPAPSPHTASIDPELAAEGARPVEGMRTAKPNGLARVFYASNAPGEHLGCLPPTALRIEMISEDGKPRWFYPTWLDTFEQASRAADWLNDRGITTTRDALRKLIQTDDEFDAIKPAPVDA